MNRRQSWNITAIFLLILFGLSFATLVHPKKEFSETENRSLAQLPEVTAESILDGTFESDYETYLTDQFMMRDTWIGIKTNVLRATGRQDVRDIYFADNGNLIEAHTGTFTAQQADANVKLLAQFISDMSQTYDKDHLSVIVAPNAVDILRDDLPAFAAPYDEENYLSKIAEALPEGIWTDTSSVLGEHKNEYIYYHTDHHWTTLGAFYTYQAWASQKNIANVSLTDYTVTSVTDTFQGTISAKIGMNGTMDTIDRYDSGKKLSPVLTYNQSDDVRHTMYQESKLSSRDKYAYFLGGNYGLIEMKTGAGTGRKLLMIKDSYGHCFVPFLADNFDEIDMVDLRYFNQSLKEYMGQKGFTDVLFLYNASGFAEDVSFAKLLS